MKKTVTCIICPKGCSVTVDTTNSSASGNSCKKGAEYAIQECTFPMRTVTSTIKIDNRPERRICVKTKLPVPKSAICDIMNIIHNTTISAPASIGDVIIPDVFGTEIVATSDVE